MVTAMGVNTYMCTKSKNYSLQGDFYSENFYYIDIKLYRCSNSSYSKVTCKDRATIDAFFEP